MSSGKHNDVAGNGGVEKRNIEVIKDNSAQIADPSGNNKVPDDVSVDEPPPLIRSFTEASLKEIVLENARKAGCETPTPSQKAAMRVVLAGRDLMACARTGPAKSAIFLMPIINELLTDMVGVVVGSPQVVVVTPTRDAANNIFIEARKFALASYPRISVISGGTSMRHQNNQIVKGCHILIVTPDRLIDFVNRGNVDFRRVRFVVLDEVDRMLEMEFEDEIAQIMYHETMKPPHERQTLMFSATFAQEIQELAGQYLNNYIYTNIGIVEGACSNVVQTIIETDKCNKRDHLMALVEEDCQGTVLFVKTATTADYIANVLCMSGYSCISIHGIRLDRQREEALQDFKSGRMQVLITKLVVSDDLDIKDVRHVVNYDMPKSIEEYVHRISSAKRATSFFDPSSDGAIVSDLVRVLKGAKQQVPGFLMQLTVGGDADRRDAHDGTTLKAEES